MSAQIRSWFNSDEPVRPGEDAERAAINEALRESRPRMNVCPPPRQPEELRRRTVFEGCGCTIYGYPSSGGVIIKRDANIVDMKFLHLDRFAPPKTRGDDAEEEDAFCRRLRMVGGTWWEDLDRASNVMIGIQKSVGEERVVRCFGWEKEDDEALQNGMYVLECDEDDVLVFEMARLYMAVNMEERIRIMKDMGATFYSRARDYDALREVSLPNETVEKAEG